MIRKMLKSKLHRAVVTGTKLDYEGSITIDANLLEAADILEYEQVQVVNIFSGARFETYAISGEKGSGVVELNGAAARLAVPGDLVIIMAHSLISDPVPETFCPKKVMIDDSNKVKEILCS
jgi:aspartate 1-decarboxylase